MSMWLVIHLSQNTMNLIVIYTNDTHKDNLDNTLNNAYIYFLSPRSHWNWTAYHALSDLLAGKW